MQISNKMKKYLIKIALLFVIIILCDYAFGIGMDYVVNHISVGGQGRDNHICNESAEDILVFGSSRAIHHYNAKMMEDSLHMTCYNCGNDGSGIVLSYGRLLMVKERKTPKIIIQDVESTFDLLENDNHQYFDWLKARYDRNGIHEIFDTIDPTEKYKMMSHIYRYNTKFVQNLFVYLTSISTDAGIKGFRPLEGELDTMKINKKKMDADDNSYQFDKVKLGFVNQFIEAAGDAQIYFVVSPIWYGADTLQYLPIKNICRQRGIPFIDFSNDPKYVHQNKYFKNGTHLNSRGADQFTHDIIEILRKNGAVQP